MECAILGWPPDGPTFRLDHEAFAYAGKFVMGDTGKAVARDGDDRVGAAAFSPDRTAEDALVIRYVTVRRDRQGEGIGPQLLRYVAERALGRGFETVRIAVNNPYAYEAAYRAGFTYAGEETGLAEVVLEYADGESRSPDTYRDGLTPFADRDLPEDVAAFLARTRREGLPDAVWEN